MNAKMPGKDMRDRHVTALAAISYFDGVQS